MRLHLPLRGADCSILQHVPASPRHPQGLSLQPEGERAPWKPSRTRRRSPSSSSGHTHQGQQGHRPARSSAQSPGRGAGGRSTYGLGKAVPRCAASSQAWCHTCQASVLQGEGEAFHVCAHVCAYLARAGTPIPCACQMRKGWEAGGQNCRKAQ